MSRYVTPGSGCCSLSKKCRRTSICLLTHAVRRGILRCSFELFGTMAFQKLAMNRVTLWSYDTMSLWHAVAMPPRAVFCSNNWTIFPRHPSPHIARCSRATPYLEPPINTGSRTFSQGVRLYKINGPVGLCLFI